MPKNTLKLRKRGHGLWITIPAAIVRKRNLKPGDEAQFTQTGEYKFELSRVCSQTGNNEYIMTFSSVLPPVSVPDQEESNEQ